MIGLENRAETLIVMKRHFDETMTILISHLLHFGALIFFYWLLFNNKNKQNNIFKIKKHNVLFISVYNSFPTAFFSHSFVAFEWRMDKIHISK